MNKSVIYMAIITGNANSQVSISEDIYRFEPFRNLRVFFRNRRFSSGWPWSVTWPRSAERLSWTWPVLRAMVLIYWYQRIKFKSSFNYKKWQNHPALTAISGVNGFPESLIPSDSDTGSLEDMSSLPIPSEAKALSSSCGAGCGITTYKKNQRNILHLVSTLNRYPSPLWTLAI